MKHLWDDRDGDHFKSMQLRITKESLRRLLDEFSKYTYSPRKIIFDEILQETTTPQTTKDRIECIMLIDTTRGVWWGNPKTDERYRSRKREVK